MTITAFIIRIRQPLVRVPLWSLWFPLFGLPHFLLHTLLAGHAKRMLHAGYWHTAFAIYQIGLDGWKD
jgi:hypothetical protein